MYVVIFRNKITRTLYPISNGEKLIDFLISLIEMDKIPNYNFNIFYLYSKDNRRCAGISGTFTMDYILSEAIRHSNDILNNFDTWCMGVMEGNK